MYPLRRSLNTQKGMGLKADGLTATSTPKPLLGYTDTETVKLDFDDTPFKIVKYWALRIVKWFQLGGFVILKSSTNCYHVVFNRKVSWSENMKIVAWASLLSHNRGLVKYLQMQCIKESSTLRVSVKKNKPSPRIVFRWGKEDGEICTFLRYRKLIKQIIRLRS
jgi:hypothetical protein